MVTKSGGWGMVAVRGTSSKLLKSYYRLTSAPDPANIRPLKVLKRALLHVQKEWRASENYEFAKDQLRSIRQDLTVQHHKNAFAIKVYETHGR